jgi:hypothetical protein
MTIEDGKTAYRQFKVKIWSPTKIWVSEPDAAEPDEDVVHLDPLRKKTIDVFCEWLAAGKITSRNELVVLGSHLYEILFNDSSDEAFRKEVDKINEKKESVLRLLLEFKEEAHELAELPWEYIYLPDRSPEKGGSGDFIAAKPGLILTRYFPSKLKKLEPGPKPLRILVVVSKPKYDENGNAMRIVDSDKVVNAIEELRRDHSEIIETDLLPQPTKRSLTEKIRDFKPHVLHFIGHGRYTKDGGALAFVKEDKTTVSWIWDSSLVDCFQYHQPRLIFLHACKGAYSESYETFRGVALRLVYSRIPAVVAMQYEVENEVASSFAKRFYQSLGEGKMIDEAVQDGRGELGVYLKEEESFSSRAFGSPVVYLQSGEGIIIAEKKIRQGATLGPSSSISIAPEVQCPYAGCTGSVRLGDVKCTFCGGLLGACPNGHVIAMDKGICRSCLYEVPKVEGIEAIATTSSKPEVAKAKGSRS